MATPLMPTALPPDAAALPVLDVHAPVVAPAMLMSPPVGVAPGVAPTALAVPATPPPPPGTVMVLVPSDHDVVLPALPLVLVPLEAAVTAVPPAPMVMVADCPMASHKAFCANPPHAPPDALAPSVRFDAAPEPAPLINETRCQPVLTAVNVVLE